MPESELQSLVHRLGASINETLTDSPEIHERLQEIRDAGYEVFLIIETKVGFYPGPGSQETEQNTAPAEGPTRLNATRDDVKFLKSLKISAE